MDIAAAFDLAGRVAVVTGGSAGIGLGMARGLGQAGAAVALVGRSPERGAAAAAALQAEGIDCAFLAADMEQEEQARSVPDAAVARFGRLDILINNTGIAVRKRPEQLSMAEWRLVLETNLTSAFVASQAAYPHLCAAGGGKIINIGSIYSLFGAAFTAAYSASKGGLVQLTKALASAWAENGIQVNAILPGWVDTALTVAARQQVAGLEDKVQSRTPAGRWGTPADFAGIAVFLASGASDFVTGAAISVDGGFAAQG